LKLGNNKKNFKIPKRDFSNKNTHLIDTINFLRGNYCYPNHPLKFTGKRAIVLGDKQTAAANLLGKGDLLYQGGAVMQRLQSLLVTNIKLDDIF
jgi:hypothetical protein